VLISVRGTPRDKSRNKAAQKVLAKEGYLPKIVFKSPFVARSPTLRVQSGQRISAWGTARRDAKAIMQKLFLDALDFWNFLRYEIESLPCVRVMRGANRFGHFPRQVFLFRAICNVDA
jgi:hypothetical protein